MTSFSICKNICAKTVRILVILITTPLSRKTQTCIHTPGSPSMIPTDLKSSTLLSALEGVKLYYFDVRLHETALVVANEVSVVISYLLDSL